MRVGDRARVTYSAAMPAVRQVSGARKTRCCKSLTTRKSLINFNYFLGSRAHVMQTIRLHARLHVFVSTHGYSDINMFDGDALLKNTRTSWPFCRGSRQPAMSPVQKVAGARENPETNR
jgi:hypothetical protein